MKQESREIASCNSYAVPGLTLDPPHGLYIVGCRRDGCQPAVWAVKCEAAALLAYWEMS